MQTSEINQIDDLCFPEVKFVPIFNQSWSRTDDMGKLLDKIMLRFEVNKHI